MQVTNTYLYLFSIERHDTEIHTEKLVLRSNSKVVWIPYVVYRSSCIINMENFPFDQQNCSLKCGSWAHSAGEVDLVSVDVYHYWHTVIGHILWQLL